MSVLFIYVCVAAIKFLIGSDTFVMNPIETGGGDLSDTRKEKQTISFPSESPRVYVGLS